MKKTFLLIILIGSQLCLMGQAEQLEHLEFYRFLMNTKISLKFEQDSFTYHLNSKACTGGYRHETIKGLYSQQDNRVRFVPTYARIKAYDESISIETDPEKIKELEGSYEIFKLDSVLMLLKLDDYFMETAPAMISKNGYLRMISKINSNGKASFGGLWSTCDWGEHFTLDASLKEHLPEKWKGYLLDSPIEAKIIDSTYLAPQERPGENYAIQYIVTLDKGSSAGLKTGLRLFGEKAILRVFEVSDTESKAYLHCMPYLQEYYLDSERVFSTAKEKR